MVSFRAQTTRTGGRHPARAFFEPLSLPVRQAVRLHRQLRTSASALLIGGTVLLTGMALGMLLSTYVQSRSVASVAGLAADRVPAGDVTASTLKSLESEQAGLRVQIAGLQARLAGGSAGDKGLVEEQLQAGTIALHGPGIVASFDDSMARSVPANEDAANYILHDYDLRDVLNTLSAAGAEAISLNGERIVATTSLYCVGSTILCNTTRLSPPYIVIAIGDPALLSSALAGSPQMEKLNTRARIYDLPVKVAQQKDVQVPALLEPIMHKYAVPEK